MRTTLSNYLGLALGATLLGMPAAGTATTRQSFGAITGRAIEFPGGRPLRGAQALLDSTGPVIRHAETDSAGKFRLDSIPAGVYRLRFRRIGYAAVERREVRVAPGGTTEVHAHMEQARFVAPVTRIVGTAPAGKRLRAQNSLRTTWRPARPRQGTLVKIIVADSARVDRATLAGEPLHFLPDGPGRQSAIGAVPIDAEGRVPLVLSPGASDTIAIPVAKGNYPLERLRVAPQFGREPDSALAARMRRESQLAAAVSAEAHETPKLWRGPWARPRPGRITSSFGRGREFNGVVQSRHMGTDFAGAVGAPVRAPARGVVRLVDDFFLGGNVVYVDHGAGLVSAYLHLSRQDVAVGDTVARGDIIGRVGATGRVTGPHLHWILRYGGVTVDPMSIWSVQPAPRPAAKPAAKPAAARKRAARAPAKRRP